jgi:pyrroline-5-carboxylate reductase
MFLKGDGDMTNTKIGFIGAGNIATAIIRGAMSSGFLDSSRVMAVNKSNRGRMEKLQREYGVKPAESLRELAEECGTLVLAVKPDQVPGAVEDLVKVCEAGTRHLVISVAAGVPLQYLETALGPAFAVLDRCPTRLLKSAKESPPSAPAPG